MTRNILTLWIAMAAAALVSVTTAHAQCDGCGGRAAGIASRIGGLLRGPAAAVNQDGMTVPTSEFVSPKATAKGAVKDFFSPHRVYAYSNSGVQAGHTHEWNNSEQNVYSWHGGYKNWQYGTPTALVLTPTAAYQSSYSWGVGQTRSTPIHHQFGRGSAANVGGGNGSHFKTTPYIPTSTDEFGVYGVRSPW